MKKIDLKHFYTPNETVANEGFIDNFKNYFNRLFTTERKITNNLRLLKLRSVKQQIKIDDVPWAKVFNNGKNTPVTGTRILEVLTNHDQVRDDLIKEGSELVDQVLQAVSLTIKLKHDDKSRYGSLLKLKRSLEDTLLKIESDYPRFGYKKQITDIVTGTESEINKIITWLEERHKNEKSVLILYKFIEQIDDAHESIMRTYEKSVIVRDEQGNIKLGKEIVREATDEEAEEILFLAQEILEYFKERSYSYENNYKKFVHGAYMYVRSSV